MVDTARVPDRPGVLPGDKSAWRLMYSVHTVTCVRERSGGMADEGGTKHGEGWMSLGDGAVEWKAVGQTLVALLGASLKIGTRTCSIQAGDRRGWWGRVGMCEIRDGYASIEFRLKVWWRKTPWDTEANDEYK